MDLDIIHVQHPLSSIYTAEAEPCVLALGFFDGVHLEIGSHDYFCTSKANHW
jgi:FAD synthase